MKIILSVLLFTLLSIPIFAWAESFHLKKGNIKMDMPKNWERVKEFSGVELMLVGPMKNSNRPVVTISSSDFSHWDLDSEALKKDEAAYKEGRENWLKKYHGKALEYFKYETMTLANSAQVHTVGFRYIVGEKEFIERSHYITCDKNIYHLKFLVLVQEESKHQTIIKKMIESFACK